MTKNKILSIRLKPEEWQEFITVADDCGLNPNTHGFQKDAFMEFMQRTKEYNQDLKDRFGTLTPAKLKVLQGLINQSIATKGLYQNRRKQKQ